MALVIQTWDINPKTGGLGSQCDVTYNYELNLERQEVLDGLWTRLRQVATTPHGADDSLSISPAEGKVFDGNEWYDVVGKVSVELIGEDAGRDNSFDSDNVLLSGLDEHDIPCKMGPQLKFRTFRVTASDLSEDSEGDEVYLRVTITIEGVTPIVEYSTVITGNWTDI
jgi:hypothetical protein